MAESAREPQSPRAKRNRKRAANVLAPLLFFPALLGCGGGVAPSALASDKRAETHSTEDKLALTSARELVKKGEYRSAAETLEGVSFREEADRLFFAELLLTLGEEVRVEALLEKESSSQAKIFRARALHARGETKAGRALLESETSDPRALLLLGELALFLGDRDAGRAVLEPLGKRGDVEPFVRGRAAQLLGDAKRANAAFNEAEEKGDFALELVLARLTLFLDKYDSAHAGELLREAQPKFPNHPELRLVEARLALVDALDFARAESLAESVLEVRPRSPEARAILVSIALRDGDFERAEKMLTAALRDAPHHLGLLSLEAALAFLADRDEDFERSLARASEVSPKNSAPYKVLAEHAEWEHRYSELDRLLRRAIRLDRGDGSLRAQLGLNLIRFGDESEALVELREAYRLDPFDVRVINTLDLFERAVKPNYVEIRQPPFVFRFPKNEAPLLLRYVPKLAEEAFRDFVARYGIEPPRVQIELYASTSEFAVRTSGLPNVGIAGVCFGRKLAAVTPQGSLTNLGMTLWHELAHVFHLELSKNRVPRWVTEGLAEWETKKLARGWSREMDPELHEVLEAKALRPLREMNQSFSRAQSIRDVVVAYYASERLMSFLASSRGERKVVEMLGRLGKKEGFPKAFETAMGGSFETLDGEFRQSIGKELARFDTQLRSGVPRGTIAELEAKSRADGHTTVDELRAYQALAQSGATQPARTALEKLYEESKDPEVGLVLAKLWLRSDQGSERARTILTGLLEQGADGLEVRLALAEMALQSELFDEVEVHAKRAVELDPDSAEGFSFLAAVATHRKDVTAELAAVRRVAFLSENSFQAHERALELVLVTKDYRGAEALVDGALWAGLSRCKTHQLAEQVLARLKNGKRAAFEKETLALVCPK